MRGSKPSGNQPKTAKVAKGLITIGQVVGSFGLQGWLKVEPLTDFPERFAPGAVVCLKGRDHVVETRSVHKGQIRLKLEGISTPEQAEAVRWEMLTVPKTSRPTLAEGEYLSKDLIGLLVLNVDGREVGIIDEIIPTPANDCADTLGVPVRQGSEP